ncbi:hypothetical protein [Tenacibaculum maritimum]|uniref:hypothetical protein n=1 Tax=Tenacibaculum maritimum TaxID=107401 RepID=UPI003890CB32
METLQITKDDAIKAHGKATKKGKKLLENLFGKKTFYNDVTERIKTIEDILKDNNTCQADIDVKFALLPEHLKYQYIIELLCKSLNEGWVADFENIGDNKYFPVFKMNHSGFCIDGCLFLKNSIHSNIRLCLKSQKLAKYAGEQFIDLYRKMITKKVIGDDKVITS